MSSSFCAENLILKFKKNLLGREEARIAREDQIQTTRNDGTEGIRKFRATKKEAAYAERIRRDATQRLRLNRNLREGEIEKQNQP